jgi:ubiquinone/menaquinone biosynthesis C-methylase UbiE
MICEHVHQAISLDLHWAMLLEQQAQMDQALIHWGILQGDMCHLPFLDQYYDVVTAGWAIGHFVGWNQANWKNQIERVIREMIRVVKRGGMMYIIETLTTGSLVPAPPTPGLRDYYNLLENKWGFSRQQIRTDYQFQNLEEAVSLVNFFFGEELAHKVKENNWVRLPEWTGVWSRSV